MSEGFAPSTRLSTALFTLGWTKRVMSPARTPKSCQLMTAAPVCCSMVRTLPFCRNVAAPAAICGLPTTSAACASGGNNTSATDR